MDRDAAVAAGTARAMLVRAFVAQNAAIGCIYGGFGISVLPLQERFAASRGAVSLGLSLVILATALAGLAVASLSRRFGLRRIILLGGTMCALGYTVLAFAPNLTIALLAFGLLVGPGVGLSGTLPAGILVSEWYPGARGRSIGLATMPVLGSLVPLAGAALIQRGGLTAFYLGLAALHAVSLPLLAGIREAPRAGRAAGSSFIPRAMTLRRLLGQPLFWATILGAGLLNAISIISSAHMVGVLIERGLPTMQAALLASVMGASSIAGAVAIGWLCDRIGGAWALVAVAGGFTLAWAVIGLGAQLVAMVPAIMTIGVVGPGIFPGVSLLFTRAFGAATMPRAMAMFGMMAVPMTFVLPAVAGWVHDLAGSYHPVMTAITLASLAVAGLFCVIGLRQPTRTGRALRP
jgi:cyanate permease